MTTRQAVEQLEAAGADADAVADIEANLVHLAEGDDEGDDPAVEEFWANQAESLAIFASPGRFETHRLPNHLTAMVEVSDRFHITPLLRAVTFPHAAWILALSQGAVRLLEVGPSGAPVEVRVEDLPKDAWQSSGNKVVRAREGAYARRVDTALRTVLTGSDLPLILAASQPMAALYRSVNTYPPTWWPSASTVTLRPAPTPSWPTRPGRSSTRSMPTRSPSWRSVSVTSADKGALQPTRPTWPACPRSVRSTRCWSTSTPASPAPSTTLVRSLADAEGAGNYGVTDEIARRVLLAGGRVLAVRAEDIPQGGPLAGLLRFVV
nr:hypothetical protein [Candidatus Microthrix sp.]